MYYPFDYIFGKGNMLNKFKVRSSQMDEAHINIDTIAEYELNPIASSLIQSMRDIGYTLNTAIADIIDNSIAAYASNIDIIYTNELHKPSLMIIDDGCGMTKGELLEALRFAYISPEEERNKDDLGRFGLGLKTATFSQARKLVVVTSKNNIISCAQWDLDYVVKTQKWLLQMPNLEDLNLSDDILEKIKPHGTMVLWQNIDKFTYEADFSKHIDSSMASLRDHIALVFHRFIDKQNVNPLVIKLNNLPIVAFDPYLNSNSHTIHHPIEKIRINDSIVSIQTHILPHHKWLKKEEENFLQTKSDLLNNQGFYIYRNNRLMVWGDWFRLLKKSEATKLARIEIHFDNKLDAEWNIDVKKSKVTPPIVVKNRLTEIIETIANSSKKVYKSRVNKGLMAKDNAWERVQVDGKIKYDINIDFSLLKNFSVALNDSQKKQFEVILNIISNTLPLESIYADISTSPNAVVNQQQDNPSHETLKEKFLQILNLLDVNSDKQKILNICYQSNLFNGYEDKLTKWVDEYVKC